MGLIVDTSVLIAAERRGDTVASLIEEIVKVAGDQDAALSAIGLTELVHGIYRAKDDIIQARRKAYIQELLRDFAVYPFTKSTAFLAGKIDGQQQAKGVTIPADDLLIAATALELNFSILTTNLRHFQLVPGLSIITI